MSPKEIDLLVETFCISNEITKEELLSKSRIPQLVKTRAALIYILRGKGLTLSQIGRAMNKNHATIIHSLKKGDSVLDRKSLSVLNNTRNDVFIKTLEDEIIACQAKIIHYTECIKSLQETINAFKPTHGN